VQIAKALIEVGWVLKSRLPAPKTPSTLVGLYRPLTSDLALKTARQAEKSHDAQFLSDFFLELRAPAGRRSPQIPPATGVFFRKILKDQGLRD
jgi:hypothetical protein